MSFEEQEYHRRRSEMELEVAVSTEDPTGALAHLELARMHYARRQLTARERLSINFAHRQGRVLHTDKEA